MKATGFVAPGLRAWSLDPTGANLPRMMGPWTPVKTVDAPDDAIEDLNAKGYSIREAKQR